MKKIRLLKAARIVGATLAFAAAVFGTVSCGDISDSETAENASKDKIILRINTTGAERTILPGAELSELTDFKLYGVQTGGCYSDWSDYSGYEGYDTPLGSYTNFTTLKNSEIEMPVSNVYQYWRFYLTAKKGSSVFAAMTPNVFELKYGDNELEFELALTELASGTGSFDFKLDYSTATNAASVTKITANLCSINNDSDRTTGSAVKTWALGAGEGAANALPASKIANFAANTVSSGNYRLFVELYAGANGDVLLGDWHETVQVSAGLSSNASRTLATLRNTYKLNYNLRPTGTPVPSSATITFDGNEVVTPSSKIPAPTTTGYTFVDWYTDSSFTTPFVIADVESYTADSTGKIQIYASWIDDSDPSIATRATIAQKIANVPNYTDATFKIIGGITSEDFGTIKEAFQKRYDDKILITLDFSEATGITELPRECFYDTRVNLAAVILPDSLEKIGNRAFINTGLSSITIPKNVNEIMPDCFIDTHLKEVIVASENKNFKAIDGVLYSKDGTKLVYYPSEKTDENYIAPSTVTRICKNAFFGNPYIKNITLSENVNFIESYAFSHLQSINSISFNGTPRIWYRFNEADDEDSDWIIDNGSAVYNIQDSVENWKGYWYYDADTYVKHPTATFTNNILPPSSKIGSPQIYRNASYNLNDNYTIVNFTNEHNETVTKWYRLETVPGKVYQVYLCTYEYSSYFTGDTEDFTSSYLYSYAADGRTLVNGYQDKVLEFTAKSDVTYFRFANSSGKIAFRVVAPSINATTTTVTIAADEEILSEGNLYKDGDYWYFQAPDYGILGRYAYDTYYYIDGEYKRSIYTGDHESVHISNLSKGIHVLTIETVKDGKRYSYSKQIKVE